MGRRTLGGGWKSRRRREPRLVIRRNGHRIPHGRAQVRREFFLEGANHTFPCPKKECKGKVRLTRSDVWMCESCRELMLPQDVERARNKLA